jgi:hypothetical protein
VTNISKFLRARCFKPAVSFRTIKNTRKMAAGNLDFLKGMALESAQLAVSYVKGEGVSGPENGTTHNATAVSNLYLTGIV